MDIPAVAGRWEGVTRAYSEEDVMRLRGSIKVEHTFAQMGAAKFWDLLHTEDYIPALGALSGNQVGRQLAAAFLPRACTSQGSHLTLCPCSPLPTPQAVQMAKAGLKAIYLSGWQVAAESNTAGATYPDQSLYPVNSVPTLVKRINNALRRADQIEAAEGHVTRDYFLPIIADAEAGFGGPLNAYELTAHLIEAGAAAVHFEDQLSSEKKCGHLGGKVLVPTSMAVRNLTAARLAADVAGTPTVIIGRTDAHSASLLTSDIDERDRAFCTGERTPEGFHRVRCGVELAIARGLAYAPHADIIWCETDKPDLEEARQFAEGIHAQFPGKLLAYNCSPSFNWRKHLSEDQIASFQRDIAALGYKFQFVTLAGYHALNYSMFDLAAGYCKRGMAAYSELQQREFAAEGAGYTAVKHQREAATGYFDAVSTVVHTGGESSTLALKGSTEAAQF